MAEDGSGFYSYRDSSSSSTNEFGEDAALDHALLESLFYDMSDGDAGRMAGSTMDVSASNSTSSSVSTCSFAQFLSEHTDSLNFMGSISRPPSPLPFGTGLPPTPPSFFRAATPSSLLEPSVDPWSLIPSSSETSSAFAHAPEAVPSVPSSSTSLPPALNNNGPSTETSTTSATYHNTNSHTNPQPQPQQSNRAKQLVSQFATLASRLGISLPPNVLTSLTVLAAQKEEASGMAAGDPSTTTATPISGLNHHTTTTTESSRLAPLGMAPPLQPPPLVPPSSVVPPMNNASLATPAVVMPTRIRPETIPSSQTRTATTTTTTLPMPLVPNQVSAHSFLTSSRQADTHMLPTDGDSSSLTSELRRTADAAVEAVQQTKKRDYPDETPSASGSAPQQYSKRKKKPRLDDCERKVAELKRENAMLKRHLNNVLHKTQQFDKERQVAEAKMKTMVRKGASEEELHSVLAKFTEMYSDYGRHRHQELTFHLEQLEKLAAPTTFTKMGLWSLGQNDQFYTDPKRNPIAGILMKELGITPAQGRKIIDNREKVRALCANIKQCLVLLSKLKALCEHKQKLFAGRMAKCQENLTPLQVVKLLIWVDDHSSTLESVCPGWGSERIPPKPPTSTTSTTTTTETSSPSLTLHHTSSDDESS